jgi:hypothetical protein
MLLRIFGAGLILLSAAVYPLIGAIALNSYFTVTEKAIYSSLAYGFSWLILLLGVFLAGPELVEKLKSVYERFKDRILKKNKGI